MHPFCELGQQAFVLGVALLVAAHRDLLGVVLALGLLLSVAFRCVILFHD